MRIERAQGVFKEGLGLGLGQGQNEPVGPGAAVKRQGSQSSRTVENVPALNPDAAIEKCLHDSALLEVLETRRMNPDRSALRRD